MPDSEGLTDINLEKRRKKRKRKVVRHPFQNFFRVNMNPMDRIFKNPYLNSVYAEAYIVIVASIIHSIGEPDTPDTFFDPIAALSLLVLSAAVMGYLFVGVPLQLYLDGEKKRSVAFFMRTVLGFAALTTIAFVIVSIVPR